MKPISESIVEFTKNEGKMKELDIERQEKDEAKIQQITGSGKVRENNGYDGIIDNAGNKPTWFYFLTTKDNKNIKAGTEVTFDIDKRGNAINLKVSE